MKKLSALFLLIICILFCSCGKNVVSRTDYPLRAVYIGDTQLDVPEGFISVFDNQTALLSIDGNSCQIDLSQNDFAVNGLKASYSADKDKFVIDIPELNLKYIFSSSVIENETVPEIQETGTECSGRVYFSNVSDKFSDYEGVSLEVHGILNDSGYRLYCHSYSGQVPFMTIDKDGKGLLMNYEVHAKIEEVKMEGDFLIDRYDIADPFKYRPWDAPTEYYAEQETTVKDVTSIKGNCSGEFDFEILIEKGTS